MKRVIITILEKLLGDLKADNSNLSEEEMMKVAECLNKINEHQKEEFSMGEASKYLHMCESSFRNKVREGVIPKGIKESHKTLYWLRKDLDKYIKDYGNKE